MLTANQRDIIQQVHLFWGVEKINYCKLVKSTRADSKLRYGDLHEVSHIILNNTIACETPYLFESLRIITLDMHPICFEIWTYK